MTCKKNKMLIAGLLLLMSAGVACAEPASPAAPANRTYTLVSDSQDVVHDEVNGTVIHSTSGACVRTKWMSPSDVCAPAEAPMVQAPPPPPPAPALKRSREERTVYFAFNQARCRRK